MRQDGNAIIFDSPEEARKLYEIMTGQKEDAESDSFIDLFTDLLKDIFSPEPEAE